jgi:membrane-bound lytic murein transglycosylase B
VQRRKHSGRFQGVVNVFALKGSWAGAFGLSQFLPSSFLRLALDGNGDGNIDLFSLPDAAHSVGNYLKGHGWTSSPEAQHKAVFGYNNSTKYVEAVLTLAELTQKQIDSAGGNKPQ